MPHKWFGEILPACHPSKISGNGNEIEPRHFEMQFQTTFQKKVAGQWYDAVNFKKTAQRNFISFIKTLT